MKWLLLLIPNIAFSGVPSCYPADGIAAETVPNVVIQSGGACVQWHCPSPDGHKWERAHICGTWSEATDQAIATLRSAMNSDKATKDAMWTAAFTQPVVAGSVDDQLLTAAKARPLPDKVPPSGLVTQDTKAYKLSTAINAAPSWVLVGSIALGTTCDASQRFGDYFRVNRDSVKFPAGVIKPPTVWAKCL